MCKHQPPCPDVLASDRMAARVMVSHPEQGWSLLCNGVVLFDDAGALLPGGREVAPPSMVGVFWHPEPVVPTPPPGVRALAAAA